MTPSTVRSDRRAYPAPAEVDQVIVGGEILGTIAEGSSDQFDAFDSCGTFVRSFHDRNAAVLALRGLQYAKLVRVGGVR